MNLLKNCTPYFLKKRLVELTYMITNSCNMRCRHCYVLDKLNIKCDELSVEEIKEMGKHIKKLQRVYIGGGEPFTRKDIADIVISIANDWNTDVICLPTNGTLKENVLKTVSEFGEQSNKILRLHFSLNALGNNMDEFTGRPGAFQKWLDTIRSSKKITDSYPHITLIVLSTYNDINKEYFNDLMDFVIKEIGADDFSFGLVRSHNDYNPEIDLNNYDQITDEYFKKRCNQSPFLRAYRERLREVISSYYKEPAMVVPCNSGKMRVVMSPDGNVYPCEALGYPEGKEQDKWFLGNIREYGYNIQKLVGDERSVKIIQKINKIQCHCHYGVDLSLNLLCSNWFRFSVFCRGIKYALSFK